MIKTPLEYAVEIDPDTLCEYTGINDNDGSRIFQNDIIRKSRVRWNPMGYWDLTDDQHKGLHEYNHAKFYIGGNIFDDPEMLKYKL